MPDQSSGSSGPGSPGQVAAVWARVRGRLQGEVGEVEYRTWLKHMTLVGISEDEAVIALPTRFMRDWVRSHYADRVSALWHAELRGIRNVEFIVRSSVQIGGLAETQIAPPEPGPQPAPVASRFTPFLVASRGEERLEPARDPRFTFDSFVVGKPNEFAYACARRVAEMPASPGFNPLFLYGGVGLGKTHLMLAIAWELTDPARPGGPLSVTYMSAERFMYRFIAALRSKSTMEFKEELRSVDVLMIDDLQFLIGKDTTQEEFFHTFNALVDGGKQIVVSADKSPSDLSGLEDRVRTRLGCGMVADLHATTFELRMSILEAKATRAGVPVPPKVNEFLAHKITSNVRELEGAQNRLIAHANLFGRAITLESAQEVLHDLLKSFDRRVSIEEIQRRVAEHYNIRLSDMSSARRSRAVARPRQVAMYLAKQLTSRSLPEIGRKFGNRDHTTVMHAVSRVTELMGLDAAFAEDVELLRRMLES
ncbi:MAG: chromosomal replication initiator protein DnaA [Alphaproteobacteria bacterium]|nr:chromosomal replication initiator protein DnaA [Alphaproteobacteria bacterium]